jgi:hypothetical protein
MTAPSPLHANAVAAFGPEGWRAVLISGDSGAGKSELTLRLLGRGWRLIADDYSLVWASGQRLYAAPPPTIVDRIEARGVGIVRSPALPMARAVLFIEGDSEPERLPDPSSRAVDGVELPLLRLDLHAPSAVELVSLAMARLSSASGLAY